MIRDIRATMNRDYARLRRATKQHATKQLVTNHKALPPHVTRNHEVLYLRGGVFRSKARTEQRARGIRQRNPRRVLVSVVTRQGYSGVYVRVL